MRLPGVSLIAAFLASASFGTPMDAQQPRAATPVVQQAKTSGPAKRDRRARVHGLVSDSISTLDESAPSDPAGVYARFTVPPRGEFESREQFRARANVATDSAYAISLPVARGARRSPCEVGLQYDADAKQLRIDVGGEEVWSLTSEPEGGRNVLALACFGGAKRSYVGENAFGKRVRVTAADRRYVAVTDPDWSELSWLEVVPLAMSPDSAAALVDHVRAAIVFEPVAGPDGSVTSVGTNYVKATIDSPIELSVTSETVWARNIQVWLVDARTGQVVARQRVAPYDLHVR